MDCRFYSYSQEKANAETAWTQIKLSVGILIQPKVIHYLEMILSHPGDVSEIITDPSGCSNSNNNKQKKFIFMEGLTRKVRVCYLFMP